MYTELYPTWPPTKTIWIGPWIVPPICSLLQHPWTGTPNHMFVQCSCQILTGYDASVENFGDKAPNPVDSRVLLEVLATSDRFPLVITSSWSFGPLFLTETLAKKCVADILLQVLLDIHGYLVICTPRCVAARGRRFEPGFLSPIDYLQSAWPGGSVLVGLVWCTWKSGNIRLWGIGWVGNGQVCSGKCWVSALSLFWSNVWVVTLELMLWWVLMFCLGLKVGVPLEISKQGKEGDRLCPTTQGAAVAVPAWPSDQRKSALDL